jgi:hypothetical protein
MTGCQVCGYQWLHVFQDEDMEWSNHPRYLKQDEDKEWVVCSGIGSMSHPMMQGLNLEIVTQGLGCLVTFVVRIC